MWLLASVKAEAEKVAAEGTTLNQFINAAVAEKLAALRTAQYFQGRASRADLAAFDRLLTRAGGQPLYGQAMKSKGARSLAAPRSVATHGLSLDQS